jgi:hypothetical protein
MSFRGEEFLPRRAQRDNLQHSDYGLHIAVFRHCGVPGCKNSRPGDGFRHAGPHELDQETLFTDTVEELTMMHPVEDLWLEPCGSDTLRTLARAIQDVSTLDLVFQSEINEQQYKAGVFTDWEIREFDRNRRQTLRRIRNILEKRQILHHTNGQGGFSGQAPHFSSWQSALYESDYDDDSFDQYDPFYLSE